MEKFLKKSTKRMHISPKGCSYQSYWEESYLFTEFKNTVICLVCSFKLTWIKVYNARQHYKNRHEQIHADYDKKTLTAEICRLKKLLCAQQNSFCKKNPRNPKHQEDLLKASYKLSIDSLRSYYTYIYVTSLFNNA